eukprot:CAMPEP_0184326330 /NCGR_PEP_ID=MMETSP1049-20130417/142506_1 /TAXON_ID=77928 /ORGANISM="Proteomonas sulcata, Strain CCMP704" /LENGTH=237 /DNA_ID=CAMNT_0026648517 /DNA_START=945 /DNA_END=1659 /DNA_ORIENTATION=-
MATHPDQQSAESVERENTVDPFRTSVGIAVSAERQGCGIAVSAERQGCGIAVSAERQGCGIAVYPVRFWIDFERQGDLCDGAATPESYLCDGAPTYKSLALRAKSLLNSRGILEFHLMEVHNERFPKKNFNAKQICESLKTEEPVESKPKAWRLQECYNQMANSNPNCSFFQKPMGDALYCMYRTLSQDIHGYPWSGESVLIVETLPHEMKVYLKCLAKKTFGLESREVSARLLNGL